MQTLPAGTVTFLFTDIEGSTARWDRQPDAMRAALARHNALLRATVERHGGRVFKTIGDAVCAAFPTASGALAAAVEGLRDIAAEDWSAFGDGFAPLAVRMGLHTGEATDSDGDYFGPTVNRVARLQAAGHGGQILLSAATRALIDATGGPAAGVRWRDHGTHRLKDLRHSERIVQAVVDGLADVVVPPRSAGVLDARDRIVIADPARVGGGVPGITGDGTIDAPPVQERTVDETLAALLAVVRADAAAVTLTPAQLRAAALHRPTDWRAWRLGRVAEWSQPRYRLDDRFVALTLLVDQGEAAESGRWSARPERFRDLGAALAAVDDRALILLGPPGSGKSTLLRRLELDTAIDGLRRGDGGDATPVTFFAPLNGYAADGPHAEPPAPGAWLAARWSDRFPDLPALDPLVAAGQVTFLLDGLNEMPAANEAELSAWILRWRAWLRDVVGAHPGNRVVFSCRTLDYSQPLSTADVRVAQVRIEPLSDAQVRDFLKAYTPGRWRDILASIRATPELDVLRSPYFLALLIDQVETAGELPTGHAALLTGFVRQALRREVERGGPLFQPGPLLDGRDLRQLTTWRWRTPYDLPARGPLVALLTRLAFAMQLAGPSGDRRQVRISRDGALALIVDEHGPAVVAAGLALAVLDEDPAADELMFSHQLLQEYFAARVLAAAPQPALVRRPWRADAVMPPLDDILDRPDPAGELPPLPATGWEETTLLAAPMAAQPAAFVRGLMAESLSLAGRAAAQADVRAALGDGLDTLCEALVQRSRDPAADVRERIACAFALGDLGDPRFRRSAGPHRTVAAPPVASVPGGRYPIGDDAPIAWSIPGVRDVTADHCPRHTVALAPFQVGLFPVTNAEWALFAAAGGYDDPRWWDTPDGERWRTGALANEGARRNSRHWRRRFADDPGLFDAMAAAGQFSSTEVRDRWRGWITLDDAAFEAAVAARWGVERATEPAFWRDPGLNRAAQPVVGISWYEARAYCAWLGAQLGDPVRLPTEVEWEAAARGPEGWPYPWGETFHRARANTRALRVGTTTPIGVFPDGDTPAGVTDLCGNVVEWTTSLWGPADEASSFRYPYEPRDGREDVGASCDELRIVRGGAWNYGAELASPVFRFRLHPTSRDFNLGFRVVFPPRATTGPPIDYNP